MAGIPMRRLGWRVPILMYHRVAEGESDPLLARFATPPPRFEQQLAWLHRLGCHTVSPLDVADWLGNGRPLPRRPVVLTFDDGYRDTYEVAAPLLERCGFRATVFLVADYVGRRAAWDQGGEAPLLSWEQARDLLRRGFTIGSHSRTHPELPQLDEAALREEVAASRALLGRQLAAPVDLFAYPYSLTDRRCQKAVRDAGYRAACAGEAQGYHRWCLDRVNTAQSTLAVFLAKLVPWFYAVRRARGVGRRAVGAPSREGERRARV